MNSQQTELRNLFPTQQVGHITEINAPLHISADLDDADALFDADPELDSVPVESQDGVVGMLERHRLLNRDRKGLGPFFRNTIEHLVTEPPVTLDAEQHIEYALQMIFNRPDQTEIRNVLVYHRRHLLGTVNTRRLVQHILEFRQNELDKAKDVQQRLLGDTVIDHPRFSARALLEMAHELGGDFLQMIRLPGDRHLLACFDVSGKNLSAALCTGLISGFFTTLRTTGMTNEMGVPDILRSLNELLVATMSTGMFVTAVFIFVDAEARRLEVFNAGYNNLFELTDTEDRRHVVRIHKPTLPPLGLDPEWDPSKGRKVIAVHGTARYFCYSDGLTDTRDETGRAYGEDRAIAFIKEHFYVSSGDFLEALRDDVRSFMGRAHPTDDMTALFLEFLPD